MGRRRLATYCWWSWWNNFVEGPKDAIQTNAPADHSQKDDFASSTLDINWNTLRVPFTEKMGSVGNGKLTLIGQALWQIILIYL